ncbi:hypothetical protein Bca4012_083472 [Brassica carinata]|uniref:At2g35280-like TPR domain-containing protein n=1 Tax=Brassica carinata TaxID=52824 RepID=A0A8X7SLK1_BRACI|nr:hypothetical protein Bca52824_027257 [Brassica carinata]
MGEEMSVNNYNNNPSSDSSNNDHSSSDPNIYFRNLSLAFFVAHPMEFLTKHKRLREECLKHGNLEGHYIEGIPQFFVEKDKNKGFFHLHQAAIGGYRDGWYLSGLLMLALERFYKGEKYLDKLQWKTNLSVSDHCKERVLKTLSTICGIMNAGYYTAMVNLECLTKCDQKNSSNHICDECYYYKQLKKFVLFAMNQYN